MMVGEVIKMGNIDNALTKLQDAEFEVLLEIRRICEKYNLTYYLSGGTYLGAVRHQGFIPWDDDMDIALPRSDYMKFTKVVKHELPSGMEFVAYDTNSEYKHPVARINNNSVHIINHSYKKDRIESAWVDIFPLDGMPSTKIAMQVHKVHLLWRRVMIGWANYQNLQELKPNRPWYEKCLMFIGKTLKPGRFMNLNKQYKKMEKVLMSIPDESSKVYMNFHGAYRFNSIMEKDFYYGDGAKYTFRGELFNAPQNYDAYLKKIYGDYMKLPPEEDRNKHKTEVVVI